MRRLLLLASLAMCSTIAANAQELTADDLAMDIPAMQEVAASAGIDHRYLGPWEFFVGGGAASFDCNGDRFPDLMLAGGTSETQLYVNRSEAGGALKFEKRAIDVNPSDLENVTGLYPIDIDNDGFRDVVVLKVGRNLVLKGGPADGVDQSTLQDISEGADPGHR